MRRRQFLATTAAATASAVTMTAGCIGPDNTDTDPSDVDVSDIDPESVLPSPTAPQDPVVSAPLPEPATTDYPTIGSNADAPTIEVYTNPKCPHCADFATGFFEDLVTEYVEPGDVNIKSRSLVLAGEDPVLGADAPDIARAGLAVWEHEPESYWAFHDYVMRNQLPMSEEWGRASVLAAYMKGAGVSKETIARAVFAMENDGYTDRLKRTGEVATRIGVDIVPMVVVDGDVISANKMERVTAAIDAVTAVE